MDLKCCNSCETAKQLEETVKFMKVISEKNRIKVLCMLREGERCVCQISEHLNLPQNLTSHHLKVLKDFGLITDRKDGLKVYYEINKKEMLKFNLLLNKFLQSYGN